ncbi:hypothetical protein [Nonomuraea jabiensis]|uniref:hypothetical protein n=1 Tax=Nonomuraea jabiensis TaxID=882448 RepID=UPI00369444E9
MPRVGPEHALDRATPVHHRVLSVAAGMMAAMASSWEGDVKPAGRAVEITDREVPASFGLPSEESHLFRIDLSVRPGSTGLRGHRPVGPHWTVAGWG